MKLAEKIDVNGLSFNVMVEGTGKPVLLLHGFPDSAKVWQHVIPHLVKEGYKVITFDQRGYGQSDAPAGVSPYSYDLIMSDAIGILKKLGIESGVRLVGHDWGALIGWLLCIDHPEMFNRYVAISVGHPLAYREAGLMQKLKAWYIAFFQIPALPELLISANNWERLRKMAGTKEEKEERVRDFSRPGRMTAAINWYRANIIKLRYGRFARHNKVPTMGVYSSNDVALTEKQMKDSHKYMEARWKYVRIENSSHWIPLDQPEELSRHICDWLRS